MTRPTSFLIGRKRKRFGECAGYIVTDCGKCHNCLDKPKLGGRGVLKQCCTTRKYKRQTC